VCIVNGKDIVVYIEDPMASFMKSRRVTADNLKFKIPPSPKQYTFSSYIRSNFHGNRQHESKSFGKKNKYQHISITFKEAGAMYGNHFGSPTNVYAMVNILLWHEKQNQLQSS